MDKMTSGNTVLISKLIRGTKLTRYLIQLDALISINMSRWKEKWNLFLKKLEVKKLRVATICREHPKEFFVMFNSRKPMQNSISFITNENSILQFNDKDTSNTLLYFCIYKRKFASQSHSKFNVIGR